MSSGSESACFRCDQEGCNITDEAMASWGSWMDGELEKKLGGAQKKRKVVASALNFSRNELGDEGVQHMVDWLRRREVGVQMLRFFKNSIGDAGAFSISNLVEHSPEPVREVHLSHNRISSEGARSLFEAISRSGRYPYAVSASRTAPQGLMPMWLRIEYNCISWAALESRFKKQEVSWCCAETKEAWGPKGQECPMVNVHNSYMNQRASHDGGRSRDSYNKMGSSYEGSSYDKTGSTADGGAASVATASRWKPVDRDKSGQNKQANWQAAQQEAPARAEAASQAASAAATPAEEAEAQKAAEQPHDKVAGGVVESAPPVGQQEPEPEEVPMYIFVDAGMLRRMCDDQEDLLSFQALLAMCRQGAFACAPRAGVSSLPQAREADRVIFLVTDAVIDELSSQGWDRFDWLTKDAESPLLVGNDWGVVEVIETTLHSQLLKLSRAQELAASRRGLGRGLVKLLDFACLWASQIDQEDRVLILSNSEEFCRFAMEGGVVRAIHADEAKRRLLEDPTGTSEPPLEEAAEGGAQAAAAARGARFSAELVSSLFLSGVAAHLGGSVPEAAAAGAEAGGLLRELQGAISLLSEARILLGLNPGDVDTASCAKHIDESVRRWERIVTGRMP